MKTAKTIANAFLAITLLIATTGITLNKHYCMGRLKAVAINEQVSLCAESGEEKLPCCDDIRQEFKIEDVTQIAFDFDSQPDLFEIAFIQFFVFQQSFNSEEQRPLLVHDPPLPAPIDYQVAYQIFLI